LLTFLLYRVTVKATVRDIVAQSIASQALSHVIHHAALSTLLTGSAAWNRTNKFKSVQSYRSALLSTKEEFLIGSLLLLFVVVAYLKFPYQGLSLMFLIGIVYIALGYFAAPLMAMIGVWSFKHEPKRQIVTSHIVTG
jgi:K+-sensing histidine kinase KdpD